MPDPLTPEQIELLRSLQPLGSRDALVLGMDEFDPADLAALVSRGLADAVKSDDDKHYGVQRLPSGDILLATLDATRTEVIDELVRRARAVDNGGFYECDSTDIADELRDVIAWLLPSYPKGSEDG